MRCAARTWWCCARGEDFTTVGEFTVAAGETVPFVLTYGPAYRALPGVIDAAEALRETETFWRAWANIAKPSGEWSQATERSLITLKALTHFPTGGIVAAPTTSLPERLGGKRNWDYRFCWLRDATFTLIALMNAGYYEDARAWREWLLRAVAGALDRVQIMYAVTGEHRLPEWEVPWLCGYQGAPSRYAPAMPQPSRCKLTCSARSWTRYIMADLAISAQCRGLAIATRVARSSGTCLAGGGPRHSGSARRSPAFHQFQGHGLGGVRPRGQERRAVQDGRAGRALAQAAPSHSRRRLPVQLRSLARRFCAEL